MTENNIIARVIAKAGNQHILSQKLGIKYQAIQSWRKKHKIPAERVLAIEHLTGISREELRPDLYGEYNAPKRRKKA